jgi:hypothetical protein
MSLSNTYSQSDVMSAASTYDLFIALIILTCLVLLLIITCILVQCIRQHKTAQRQQQCIDIEASQPIREELPPRPVSRAQSQYEHYYQQERLSMRTPSIELLPEIRTSNDRADDWLERRGSKLDGGDLGAKEDLKTIKVVGVKADRTYGWDWRNEKVEGVDKEEKDKEVKKKDSVIVEKEKEDEKKDSVIVEES